MYLNSNNTSIFFPNIIHITKLLRKMKTINLKLSDQENDVLLASIIFLDK